MTAITAFNIKIEIVLFLDTLEQKAMLLLSVRQARAALAVRSSVLATCYNILAAMMISGLLLLERKGGEGLALWFAILSAAAVFRLCQAYLLRSTGRGSAHPEDTMRFAGLSAAFHGLVWAALPTIVVDVDMLGEDAPVLLIIGGLVAMSMFRQAGTSHIAFCFSTPIILATIWNFANHGGIAGIVSTLNLMLLTVWMFHLLLRADKAFVESETAKLRNQAVTQKLTIANEDIKHKNVRLEVLANGDPVTGLYNRIYFNGRLAGEIAAAKVGQRQVGLLLVNVNRFKLINDAFGHRGGDQFLAILGQQLKTIVGNTVGPEAITARIGGDEFAILLLDGNVGENSNVLATKLTAPSLAPVPIQGVQVNYGLSVGIAVFPDHAEDAEGLFTCASMALSQAKRAGPRQVREFDLAIKTRIDRQRDIEQDLADAMAKGELETWFQPQIDLATGGIVGFEALLRWFHPRFGAIAPPEIVDAAQAMQLCETLTAFVTERICRLLQRLPSLGLPDANVALNVSPREFALYDVSVMLDRITETHGVDRRLLEVEITEETILDPAVAGEQLSRLEEGGYKLTVDDFGIGYSSLAYLISLKIGRLKIDRSFVTDIDNSHKNKAMIVALVGLGRAIGVDIVVEGVETAADAATLKEIGCNIGQGYHFARPMPADMLPRWIERKNKGVEDDDMWQVAVA